MAPPERHTPQALKGMQNCKLSRVFVRIKLALLRSVESKILFPQSFSIIVNSCFSS